MATSQTTPHRPPRMTAWNPGHLRSCAAHHLKPRSQVAGFHSRTDPAPSAPASRLPPGLNATPFLCTAATDAGFLIEKLIEPVPAETMRERYPEDYEQLSKEPGFLILRLLKPARPSPQPAELTQH